jgi:hypothetical protein
MSQRDEQLHQPREAVDRKSAEADAASRDAGAHPRGGPPVPDEDEQAPRIGHGKKTADTWSQ